VLLKNYLKIADASETEVKACLEVARRYRLDPFKQGQIWFIKRWDRNASSVSGAKGAYVYTPQTGIYGLLHIAGRDYPDFGSMSEAEFGPMFMHDVEGHKFKAPEWCRVKAFKKGIAEPTVATIYFEEFCPSAWDNARLFWARMPRAQIEKCAKARALRTAYPDLGGLYIPEEMDRMADQHTPSGRQIVSGAPTGGSHEAAQAVAARKIAEANQERKPLEAEIVDEKPKEYQGNVELDWTEEASPVIRGDIGNLLELLQKHCTMTWKGDWWHCLPKDAETIRAMCEQLSFRLKEIMPKKVSPRTSSEDERGEKGAVSGKAGKPAGPAQTNSAPPRTSAVRTPAENKTSAAPAVSPSNEPQLVAGIIEQATPQAGKSPRLYVLLRMETSKTAVAMTAWDTAHFPFLIAGKGQQCELMVKRNASKDGNAIFTNIVGLRRIGAKEFDHEDGKTPIIQQRTREAGSLFQK